MICSLDAEGESLVEILAPPSGMFDHDYNTGLGLGLLEDCLCVITKQAQNLELWVLNEYGNVNSWNTKFVITKGFGNYPFGGFETLTCLKKWGDSIHPSSQSHNL